MAAELSFRHTATGSTVRATIRKPLTTGGKIQMCVAGTGAFEDLTVANWATYVITMTETPASGYGYIGTWPAGLTTVGWYIVDYYDGATIAGTLSGTFLGYWDGTNFVLGGADTRQIAGVIQAVPGAAGGLFIAGTNAATTITTALTVGAITLTTPIESDLVKIHGTSLTETGAGYLAGSFVKFYDKQTPTGTINSLPDAVAGAASGISIVGSLMGLANDAITSAKFDESTAFPLKAADSGSTYVARTGADSDTLETLSDQMDVISGGAGATTDTITVVAPGGVTPVSGAEVWITADVGGVDSGTVVAGTLYTNSSGVVTFNLDDGNFWVHVEQAGYDFTTTYPKKMTVGSGAFSWA